MFDSAHDRAILEAWLVEHKGITAGAMFTRYPIDRSGVVREFGLPNSSLVILRRSGRWEHHSHIGITVKAGLGLGTLIPYLDSLKMPKATIR